MSSYFSFAYLFKTFPIILSYAPVSLVIMAVAFGLGNIIGIFGAFARINKIPFISQLVVVFVSFIRGTPLLVLLFLIYFGMPDVLVSLGYAGARQLPPLYYVIFVFTLSVGGYTIEIMRGAILAVPTGQKEAAYSVGMSEFQTYWKVILPQAFRRAVAPLCNQAISSLKGTALVFNVGVVDMMRKADLLGANSHRNIEVYINVAIIYAILIFFISRISYGIEKLLSLPEEDKSLVGKGKGE